MKDFKYKKQVFFGISLTLFICALVTIILFFICNNKSVETSTIPINNIISSNNNNTNSLEKLIPNVTKENTKFKLSETKKKVESVNISATSKLPEYNLYYLLVFKDTNTSEIKNEDYLIFNDLLLILDENCTIYFKYELDGNYSNEAYKIKISNIKIPEKETEKATEKELKEQKVDKKDTAQATSPYFIKVNYGANVVTIYTKDSDGNYTVPYKAMVCSCGTYTPTGGTYKTTNKYTWRLLINNVYGQYATRIVGSILFHSVPYTSNKKDTLEYLEYDKLGQTASAGCVRLTVRDAKWIYDNCPRGTMVEFYSSSNPGPLGKPSAQKISSVEECRNWDPTDPASNNPWHTYKAEEKENNTINNTINNSITNNINNSIVDNSISNNVPNSSNLSNNTINNVTNNTVNNSINTTTNNSIISENINNNSNSNIDNNIANNTSDNSYTNNNVVNNTINSTVTNNTTTNTSTNDTVNSNISTNTSTNSTVNNTNTSNNNVNNIINNNSNNSINSSFVDAIVDNTISN